MILPIRYRPKTTAVSKRIQSTIVWKLTDWYTDIIGDETLVVETSSNGIPTVKEDDDSEKDTSGPSQNGALVVELGSEWHARSRNTLRSHCVMESHVTDADHNPSEES